MPVEESASREKVFAAEKDIAGIRVAIIALNSVVYATMMPGVGLPVLAWTIILTANAYGLLVYVTKPYERFPAMLSSYFTSALDAVFITLWLLATGGVESPFYVLWMVSVSAVAFRYGYRETLFAAGLYAACYLGLLFALGEIVGNERDIIVRIAYIFFTAAIGGLFARETSEQMRAKVGLAHVTGQLRESEERFRTLSDATFEGIAIHEHGRVAECNATFARLFGYDRDEVVGRTLFDFIAPESHEAVAEHARLSSTRPYEAVGVRKDGGTLDVEVVDREFPYQGRMARVAAVRNVTEEKRADREARRRAELQAINDRLREMDRLRTQFINNAAHELGTPLTPIKIQAHILKAGSLGPLTDRQSHALNILQRNIDHLGLLVRDVLDASRIQGGRLTVAPRDVDLAEVVAPAVESFVEAARQQDVELTFEAERPLPVHADTSRITQVVFNLVHNALKFTPKGGHIRVRARRVGDRARIEVADDGAGIAPEDIAKLFQPFSQVHDRTLTSRSGTGLGLFVSRGIIEQHGGAIACESEGHGKGTTFRFTLPLRPAAGAS